MIEPLSRSLGIGHLAAAAFVQLWTREGNDGVTHLRRYAASEGKLAVAEYAHDARCLLATGLGDRELELIWCSCTGGNHTPGWDGLTGRQWMRVVDEVMTPYADPAMTARLAAARADPALGPRVARIVASFRASHPFSLCQTPEADARAALVGVADAGFPGLALRLFVTMALAHFSRLSPAEFRDVQTTAAALGLPDDVVADAAVLVDPQ